MGQEVFAYSVPTKRIIEEFLLRLKHTFGTNKIFYIGTTTNVEQESEKVSDIDVILVFNSLDESYITYVWKIINALHLKYNIVLDTRIYDKNDLKNVPIINQYLLMIFLNDLFGSNPFKSLKVNKELLKQECRKRIQEQEDKIIKTIPKVAGDLSQIKSISQSVYDAMRAFLIIEDLPVATKEESCKLFKDHYPDFEVEAIYRGYLNPNSIIDLTKFIFDSLAIVKHLFYKAQRNKIENSILLINTPGSLTSHPRNDYLVNDHNMPLGLVCIASYLSKQDYEVKILDSYAENLGALSTIDKIFSDMVVPKIIGFNTSSPNIHIVHKIASYIKRINKDITIVAGGAHATLAKEHTLSQGFVDYCIEGEGEIPFTDLVKSIFLNKSKSDIDINGVFYNVSGKVVGISNTTNLDLEQIPAPDFRMLPIDRYFAVKKRLYIHTTRGCAFNCIYCSVPQCWKKRVKEIPMDVIINHLRKLVSFHHPEEIQIVDDNFSHNKGKLINEFCTKLIDSNIKIKWKCQARADQLDSSTIELMSRSGCFEIDLGIESGNKETQKYIRKNLDLDKTLDVIQNISQTGIFSKAFCMLGFPDEDYEHITDTINYAIKLKEQGLGDIAFFPVMPFPGTEISAKVGKVVYQGAIIDDINVYERSFVSNRLKKYSARPEISLNKNFTPEQLRLLVKFAYTRFHYEKPVVCLKEEFLDFLLNEEEGLYAI